MRLNDKTAVATSEVLLVPYQAHHVLEYHGWMQDPSIQAATASEPLSLHEEYENQASWRTARDKLTFIVCAPLEEGASPPSASVRAREDDGEDGMRGDVNLFLYPRDDDDDDDDDGGHEAPTGPRLVGEVDVMIARTEHRGRGLGRASVRALLAYLCRHKDDVVAEYAQHEPELEGARLTGLMAKIEQGNAGSRALFEGLGFRQHGRVNYFGELTMVMDWGEVQVGGGEGGTWARGYREMAYE